MTNFFSRTSPARRLALAGTMTTLLVGLAACGGGSDSAGGSSEEPAKGASLASIQDEGVLVVGTEGTYPPFTFHEGGTGDLTGYDVEVTEAVAEKLGVDVQFEETQWDAIFAGLDVGPLRHDRQPGVDQRPSARRTTTSPSRTPFSKGVVVVNEGNDEHLARSTTSRARPPRSRSPATGTSSPRRTARRSRPSRAGPRPSTLLQQGRVDATVNDELTFLDYQNAEGGDTGLEIAATTDDAARERLRVPQGQRRPGQGRRRRARRAPRRTARSPRSPRSTSAPTSRADLRHGLGARPTPRSGRSCAAPSPGRSRCRWRRSRWGSRSRCSSR